MGPTRYTFYGKVIDPDGNGIPGVKIKVKLLEYELETDADGTFVTNPGEYAFDMSQSTPRDLFFIPHNENYCFTPDTTWVTIAWQRGVKSVDIFLPEIVGKAYLATDYFPLQTGVSWTYERTIDNGAPSDQTVSVTGTETANDITYSLMSPGYPGYYGSYRFENNTVHALSENEDKVYLMFGGVIGNDWVVDSIRENVLTGTFLDIETVEVPAGTFEDCLHFELRLPYGNTSYESTDMWFARDVGLVKTIRVLVSMGEVKESQTDELKYYNVE